MAELRRYIRPYWAFIALTLLIKLSGALTELLIPYFMEQMLDVKVPAGDLRGIWLCGGLMLLCAALCLGLNVLANRMTAVSSGKITRAVRHDLFAKLESLSARQMDALTAASANSRLTSDTYNVNQFLARIQRMGVRAPSLLVGGVVVMLGMDAKLALVLVALLPVIAVVVYFVTKTTVPLYTEEQDVLDRVVRVVRENITGIRVIKALSKTEDEKARFEDVNSELTRVDQKAGTVAAITNPASSLTLNLGLTLVVVVGAARVQAGECPSGVIVAFLQYFTMILNAMLGITRIFVMWSKGEASARRVAEVLAMPADLEPLPARADGQAQDAQNAPAIEFRHVSFSYTGVGENLHDLSFALPHGKTLGILGPTGCGKSTVLNLLMRLYDPDEGEILIDGRDVRTLEPGELRERFGVVFQNDFVTEGTIAGNIRFFRDLDDEAVSRAADDAQADFISQKEGGLNAEVTVRGGNLSGGQKQRLLIARALAGNPSILVLDDASSALDYRTDASLRRALRAHYRDTTTVVVAQRVSSLMHADLILVLEDGCVIGSGTHEVLMQTCETYRLIAQTQMGEKEAM